ncbi:glutaredoxin family protein [Alcanivorax sp. S71-1-4]|jgi:glutaredoxin|uniref:glutaredoxin family protein n=1 Tax=Alcanivorax sp. S71-1-4 TaxID=1177159 RepID=UPI001359E21E|nr:glutaredoxin family protein [Alcanivorax sp. S71-1-4]
MRLLMLVIAVLAAWQYGPTLYSAGKTQLVEAGIIRGALPGAPRERPAVVMYATRSCGYCARARKFFAEHNIPYTERNVEGRSPYRNEWQQLGASGVPTFVLGGEEVIKGWNERRLRERLL